MADSLFLAWSERRLYAVHWRMPHANRGPWLERVCCPAPGAAGLEQLSQWLNGLPFLSARQVAHVISTATPYLHALAPTASTADLLLTHPDPRIRLETQLNLASSPPVSPPRRRTPRRSQR